MSPELKYAPAGPVTAAFHASDAFVRGIMGCIGSGKSVACCMDIVMRAFAQRPGPDGMRRTRWVVVRNSYPELKSTTIQTWTDWFKPEWFGKVKWDTPISHKLKLARDCELEVLFLALDTPDDAKKLLSLEVTGAWLNEARELPKAVLDAVTGRVGRYPSKRDGGPTWWGVIMDTNPPDDDHWWHRLAEEERPENFEFFRQPSGLSDRAENVENLPPNYYTNLIPGKPQSWIKVYVEGQYGSVADGKPVYPEFNENIHVSPIHLKPYKGLPLYLGFDLGLTPACTIGQVSSRGQLRILDELVSEDMGIQQFANDIVKPFLAMKYPEMKVLSIIDPAGAQRAQTDERTCRDVLKKAGLHPSLAPTNSFVARREAVAYYLTRLVDGEPAFLMSPTAKTLRKGMNGEYKFRRMQVVGEERFKDVPEKNKYSHVCFVAGTPITVENKARVSVEHIRPGDLVYTPYGYKKVKATGSRKLADIVKVSLSDGRYLECTPDHPIWTDTGFIPADTLKYTTPICDEADVVWKSLFKFQRSVLGRSSQYLNFSASDIIESPQPGITKPRTATVIHTYTAMFGSTFSEIYQKATSYITRTITLPITTPTTWSFSPLPTTQKCTWPNPEGPTLQGSTLGGHRLERQSGGKRTPKPRQSSVTQLWRKLAPYWTRSQKLSGPATAAEKNTKCSPTWLSAGSVPLSAKPTHETHRGWTTKLAHALYAVVRSLLTNTLGCKRVRPVAVESLPPATVYNIEVEDAHCYFANGVLVSNCESLQYMALHTAGARESAKDKHRPSGNTHRPISTAGY